MAAHRANDRLAGGEVMRRAITAAEAAEPIPDGATMLFGGLMGVGTPMRIVDALVELVPQGTLAERIRADGAASAAA